MKAERRTVRDAVIRSQAVVSALNDLLSISATKRNDPHALELRADVDAARALKEFEHELASLVKSAFVAEMEWTNAANGVEAWTERHAIAKKEGNSLLARQALARQQEEALLETELRLEFEEWQQMVADYSTIIELLKARLPG